MILSCPTLHLSICRRCAEANLLEYSFSELIDADRVPRTIIPETDGRATQIPHSDEVKSAFSRLSRSVPTR